MGRVGSRRQRHRPQLLDHPGGRQRALDHLAGGRHRVAGGEGVAQPQLERVHPQRLGEPVHLRLMPEARLHRAEAPHGAARRVVRPGDVRLDEHVAAPVGPDGEVRGVGHHRGARRGVGAAVEHHAGTDSDQVPVGCRLVAVPHPRRVTVHVADEALLPVVDHLHRATGGQGEQAQVDLQRDVLPRPEGAPDAGVVHPYLVLGDPQAGDDLGVVGVGPLGRHVQVDPPLPVGHRQPRLGAERRLILHAHLVGALDHHRPGHRRIAPADVDAPEHLSPGHRLLGVDQRFQRFIADVDGGHPAAGVLGVVGGDDRHRLAPEAGDTVGEHRLVGVLQAEATGAGDIVDGEDRGHAGHLERRGDVEARHPGVSVWAAQRGPPQHPRRRDVGRVGEVADDLGDAVRAGRRGANGVGDLGPGGGAGGHAAGPLPTPVALWAASASSPRRMAP